MHRRSRAHYVSVFLEVTNLENVSDRMYFFVLERHFVLCVL